MSKRISVIIILSFLFFAVQPLAAQKKTPAATSGDKPQKEMSHTELNQKVYEQALKYNDLLVAREAIHKLIVLNPERITLKDTLTFLYYSSGNHMQVIMVGKEILEQNPNKPEVLELVGVAQQQLGMLKDALESFEKLFAQTKDMFHLYNIASLQYMLKRYGECSETLNTIIASTDDAQKVNISDAQGEGSQQVPIKAAAFNMRGVVALEINQTDVAKQNFSKALEIFPDFALAKSNLESVSAADSKAPPKKK